MLMMLRTRRSEHHEHQLGVPSREGQGAASIMSISCVCPQGKDQAQRAPRASAACAFKGPSVASIMSISCVCPQGRDQAQRASAACALKGGTRRSEHHEHQLGVPSREGPSVASIMSISCVCPQGRDQAQRASRASAGCAFKGGTKRGEHHEHQLRAPSREGPGAVSITSITSAARALKGGTRRSEHHEHQLRVPSREGPGAVSITSISWVYLQGRDQAWRAS